MIIIILGSIAFFVGISVLIALIIIKIQDKCQFLEKERERKIKEQNDIFYGDNNVNTFQIANINIDQNVEVMTLKKYDEKKEEDKKVKKHKEYTKLIEEKV